MSVALQKVDKYNYQLPIIMSSIIIIIINFFFVGVVQQNISFDTHHDYNATDRMTDFLNSIAPR